MPKKNGIPKTYSFSEETVRKMSEICNHESRSQTNMIEVLVRDKYKEVFGNDTNRSNYVSEN